jgi:streptogramin lyase
VLAADAPDLLAVGAGAVWVVNGNDFSVSKLDPSSGRISQRIPLGNYTEHLCWIAATSDAVYVTVGDSYCDTANR